MIVKNPTYTELGDIDVIYTHPEFGDIPYTASKDDVEELSVEIFTRCEAGEFGEVKEYVAPVLTEEQLARQVRDNRDELLRKYVDPVASNNLRWSELSVEQQDEVAVYRQALLDIPQQAEFPTSVTYPDTPAFLVG